MNITESSGFTEIPEPGAQPGTRPGTRILEILNPDPARNPEFRAGLARPGKNPARCPSLLLTKIKFNLYQGSGHGFERVRDKTGGAFKGGAFTDEPRRPFISNFYVLDRETRLKALLSCLTVKNIQEKFNVRAQKEESISI